MLCSHHLVSDGWSTPVLVQELLTLYARNGDAGGAGAGDAVPAIISAWLSRQDRGGARVAAWQEALAGAGGGHPCGGAGCGASGRVVPEQLTVSLTASVERWACRAGAPAGCDAQHVPAGGVGDPAGASDQPRRRCVRGDGGGPAAGDCRHRADGGAVHQHAAAAGAAGAIDAAAGSCCGQVQESQSRLMAHQHLGLGGDPGLWRGLGELFDTLVVFENYPVAVAADAGGCGGGCDLPGSAVQDATHYPLVLTALPGERLTLRLSYRGDLFDRADVEALAARLIRLLEAAVAEPERAIGSLDILAPAERETLLRGWNDTAHAASPLRRCRSCLRRRPCARPRPPRWCSRTPR